VIQLVGGLKGPPTNLQKKENQDPLFRITHAKTNEHGRRRSTHDESVHASSRGVGPETEEEAS
jgi:hypothetical protein